MPLEVSAAVEDGVNAGPLVSVCIPTYKGAATIGATIESVLAQSYANIEIIVIDDRSPDKTVEVVRGFSDSRIRLVVNERNLGAEGNWNRCLELATGVYYKLLPHDDLLAPDCLAEQVAILEADHDQSLSLVFGTRKVINSTGRALMKRGLPGSPRTRIRGCELVRKCVRAGTNLIGEPGNALMRSSLARTIGRYDARQPYVVDLDYWFRALARGDGFYTDTWSSTFRVSAGSWSASIGRRQRDDFAAFIQRGVRERFIAASSGDIRSGLLRARINMVLRLLVFRFLH